MVNKRRRLLIWLRRADFESYAYTINKLGLQDIYSHTVGQGPQRQMYVGRAAGQGDVRRASCVWRRAVCRG